MLAPAVQYCGLLQGTSALKDMMECSAACRHSFNAAWAPFGNEADLPEPMVTGLRAGVAGAVVSKTGRTVTDVGLQSELHLFEERDKYMTRYLKKSLSRLATLDSSEKTIRQTYTQFIRQATRTMTAFTQQLALFEAVQRDSETALADNLLEGQAILDHLEDSECDVFS